jgi:hypothetical protein
MSWLPTWWCNYSSANPRGEVFHIFLYITLQHTLVVDTLTHYITTYIDDWYIDTLHYSIHWLLIDGYTTLQHTLMIDTLIDYIATYIDNWYIDRLHCNIHWWLIHCYITLHHTLIIDILIHYITTYNPNGFL